MTEEAPTVVVIGTFIPFTIAPHSPFKPPTAIRM